MRSLYLAGAVALLAFPMIGSTAAAAPTESVAELVCRFGGACPGDAPANAAPAQARGPNRGFSISRSGTPTQAQAATSRAAVAPPAHARRNARPPRLAGNAARAAVIAAPVSRSDLRITFEKDSAILTPDGEQIAAAFAEALKGGLTGRRYLIGGHTDRAGSLAHNQALSQRRAKAVVDYLVAHGVEPARLKAEGFGSARPLPDRAPVSADNRRVEATPLLGVS